MNRAKGISRLKKETSRWDVIIIGGGATGLGCALDSVSRGYRTLLIEQADFGNGTSSRSTKLIHGGVRYLRQGNISLVRESLAERGWLLKHAPHLVTAQPFLIPTYSFFETWFYRIGLWMYDQLAGSLRIHSSRRCNRAMALERVPTLKADKLSGGVVYWDGQFDDSRLCIQLAQTIWAKGNLALNYVRMDRLLKVDGRVSGIEFTDILSGESFSAQGKAIIQATGIFSDAIRAADASSAEPMIRSSRGSHVVVDGDFLPNGNAIMVPKTTDGRLLFLVPWLGKVIVGTTDVPDDNLCLEPKTSEEEIDFILENAAPYLTRPIKREDVLSVYSGLRPLVVNPKKHGNTASLSRNHVIEVSDSGLITIAGGKWTTFRKMGEDAIDKAMEVGGLAVRPSRSKTMRFYGLPAEDFSPPRFSTYGADANALEAWILENPGLGETIHLQLSYTWAEVLWAIRYELAESVDDVLSRRTRSLLLDAGAAMEAAPAVGRFMAEELGRDEVWINSSVASFLQIAKNYLIP
jgi:glycerol-3-phosphate dehydrogenase